MANATARPDDEVEIFRIPVAPPRGTRNLGVRSKASSRARLVGNAVPTEIRVESGLEYRAANYLLARPDMADLQEQPEAIGYYDDDGVEHQHTFDFKATLKSGVRILIEVKPDEVAARIGLKRLLRTIARQVPKGTADRVLHLGEGFLTRRVLRNAQLVRSVRRDRECSADPVVRSVANSLVGCVKVGDIVRASGLEGLAFRAVVRMIGEGELRIVGNGRIDYATAVMRAGSLADGVRP